MKTALLIGFVLLMQQAIDARQVHRSTESKESHESRESSEESQNIQPVENEIALSPLIENSKGEVSQPEVIPAEILNDAQVPEAGLKPDNDLDIPECSKKRAASHEPVCAMNYKEIYLFYNECMLKLNKLRNVDIIWKTLPLEMCESLYEQEDKYVKVFSTLKLLHRLQ